MKISVNETNVESIIELFRNHWQRQLQEDDAQLYKKLQYYIPAKLGRSDTEALATRTDGMAEMKSFLDNDQPALLLLGDSGAGKTLFCQSFVNKMWQKPDKWLPLFIHLPLLNFRPGFVFDTYLREQCRLSFEQIDLLKTGQIKLIVFFDSYDEMRENYCGINVYQALQLHEYFIKAVVSCRTEGLVNYDLLKQQAMFTPTRVGQLAIQVERRYVQFFDVDQIPQYIGRWQELNPTLVDPKTDYFEELNKLPAIATMITNPFILWAVMEVLPDLLHDYADTKKLERYDRTRKALFDRFTQGWFVRQRDKLLKNGKILPSWGVSIVEDFHNYCQKLADYMWQHGVTSLTYKQIENENNLLNQFFAEYGDFKNDPNKSLAIIRQGALLKVFDGNVYTFLHNMLMEYFSARRLFESVAHQATIVLGLEINARRIVKDREKVRNGIDSLIQNPELEKILFDIILESKHEARIEVAAANAITILVAAGRSFSGKDLRNIRIRKANIAGGNFDNADLRDADLRKVNLSKTQLNNAKLSGACLDDVQIDESTYEKFDSAVVGVGFSPCGKYYVVLEQLSVMIFESILHKQIFKQKVNRGGRYRKLAVAGNASTILICNGKTFELLSFPKGKSLVKWHDSNLLIHDQDKNYNVKAIALNQQGQWALSAGNDNCIKRWDCADGALLNYWDCDPGVERLVLSKNGEWVITSHGINNEQIYRWDVKTGELLSSWEMPWTASLVLSADDSWILSSVYGIVPGVKRDSLTGRVLQSVEADLDRSLYVNLQVSAQLISSDQSTIFSAHRDNSIRCWNLYNGECLLTWHGHSDEINALAMSPDNTWLLTGSKDHTVRRWNCQVNSTLFSSLETAPMIAALRICSMGQSIISIASGVDRITKRWSYQTGDLLSNEENIGDCPCQITGKQCATSLYHDDILFSDTDFTYEMSYEKQVIRRNKKSGQCEEIAMGEGSVQVAAFSRDVEFIVKAFATKKYSIKHTRFGVSWTTNEKCTAIMIWNLKLTKIFASWLVVSSEFDLSHTCAIAISPDGKWVIIADSCGKILIWNTAECKMVRSYYFESISYVISWKSKDPSHILMGMDNGCLSSWTFQEDTAKLFLRWKTRPTRFDSTDCDVLGVHGLSENLQKVFSQRGARVEVSSKSSSAMIAQRCQLKQFNRNNNRRSVFDNTVILRPSWDVVTVARNKSGAGTRHAFMIIESIEEVSPGESYHRIRKIEFLLEMRHNTLPAGSSEPHATDYFGQGLIEIADKTFEEAELLAQSCFFRSETIDFMRGSKLLQAVFDDKRERLAYCKMGASGLYRLFTMRETVQHHNCLSWIRKHLENVGINIIESKLKDFFVEDPFDKIQASKPPNM